jgi:deoxyadenosine/deoxycytidine kinase
MIKPAANNGGFSFPMVNEIEITHKTWLIGVVGPCASGKSTLINGLSLENIRFRHIAQEHSYVAAMWQRLTNPDLLIFLDASYEVTCRRRRLNWTVEEYLEQHRRLAHARVHTDCYILTDDLSPLDVQNRVKEFLREQNIIP